MHLLKLSLVPLVLGVAMSSMAQVGPPPDRPDIIVEQGGPQAQGPVPEAVKERTAAVVSIQQYCSSIENLSRSLPSRLFAELPSNAGQPATWTAFSTEAQWASAGAPEPRARAWFSDGKVVLVRMTLGKGGESGSEYNYCYAANGAIARIAAVPTKQIQCDDANFRCLVISGFDRLYLPGGQKVEVVDRFDSRLLKSEKTVFATSKETPPEYLNVSGLPFGRLLQ